MTTAMNILRKLGRSGRANPVHLDASILRDIGVSAMTVEFGVIG